ncbi:MAG: sugar ABC transporter ATP-binding protein [Rhodothermales bacterium]|nr:sugar ABC transporter ATP-binding protein [Rhodothermales bacterium]
MFSLSRIVKSFGPVRALRGVDLSATAGEVHALIGENGAGKSTLMRVLSGALQPDAGHMTIDGAFYTPRTPRDGRAAGIGMIYQELTIAPHLSVLDNICLGLEHRQWGWIRPRRAEAREALQRLGQGEIDLDAPAGRLSIGKQQVVEIARALLSNARIVVMDEPTSSLSADDASALFTVIRRLRDEGVAIVYISHFLEEVMTLADRYTVLRDGESVANGSIAATHLDDIIAAMIGRPAGELYPSRHRTPGDPLLTVDNACGPDGGAPNHVSLTVHRGEVLGIAGLVGAGRSELLRTLFGLQPGESGALRIGPSGPVRLSTLTPAAALGLGINLLSEDRKAEGLAVDMTITANLTLSSARRYSKLGFLNRRHEHAAAADWVTRLGIRAHSPLQPARTLSGGNQQKLCLARLLHDDSDILLLDEPTRGIDIGSKAEIYHLIDEAARAGKAIVLTSSYLPELLGVCDTIAVMHRGALSDVRQAGEWTSNSIIRYASGGKVKSEK